MHWLLCSLETRTITRGHDLAPPPKWAAQKGGEGQSEQKALVDHGVWSCLLSWLSPLLRLTSIENHSPLRVPSRIQRGAREVALLAETFCQDLGSVLEAVTPWDPGDGGGVASRPAFSSVSEPGESDPSPSSSVDTIALLTPTLILASSD